MHIFKPKLTKNAAVVVVGIPVGAVIRTYAIPIYTVKLQGTPRNPVTYITQYPIRVLVFRLPKIDDSIVQYSLNRIQKYV